MSGLRLKLKNFKCWNDHEFNVSIDKGMVLFKGISGRGKSSLLQSIIWCVTGVGTGILTHGLSASTSCMVELEWKGVVIRRTRRPNRLVVEHNDRVYEDDVAQEYLHHQTSFGEHYALSGYIQQKGYNSFLLMRPAEKLRVLEELAFQDINLDGLKAKINGKISEYNERYVSLQTQLQLIQGELKNYPQKIDKVSFTKSEQQLLKELPLTISELDSKLKKARKDKDDYTKICELRAEIENVIDLRLNELNRELKLYSKQSEEIAELKQQIAHYQQIEKYTQAKKSVEQLQKQLIDTQQSLEVELQSQLIADVRPLEELQEEYHQKVAIKDEYELKKNLQQEIIELQVAPKQIEELNYKIEQAEKSIQQTHHQLQMLKLQQEILNCPSCESNLRLVNGQLEIAEGVEDISQSDVSALNEKKTREIKNKAKLQADLEKLKLRQQQAEDKQAQLDDLTVDLNEDDIEALILEISNLSSMEENALSNNDIQHQLENLNDNVAIRSLNNQLTVAKNTLKSIKIPNTKLLTGVSLESLQEKLTTKTQLENKFQSYQKEQQQLLTSKALYIKKCKEIKEEELTLEEVKYLRTQVDEEIIQDENQLEQVKTQLLKLQQKNQQYQIYKTYQNWQTRFDKITTLSAIGERELNAAKKVKQKLLEAESLAVATFIEKLNTHLQMYLDYFFPDDPMFAEFGSFKQNKSKKNMKAEINLNISYKGSESDFNSLSGGEQDRLQMCVTLAFADILGTKLVMMDESISSLDSELCHTILHNIESEDRLILVVAHQIPSGMFNETLEL